MGISGRRDPRLETYAITATVAVAVILLLLNIPGLGIIWRVAAILILLTLQGVNLAVLTGARRRYTRWRNDRRRLRALNRTSGLIPDLRPLVDDTHNILYGDDVRSLYNIVRRVEQEGAHDRAYRLEPAVSDLRMHYKVIQDFAEAQTFWEVTPYIYFMRNIGRHFRFLDPILKKCYEIAGEMSLKGDIIQDWETVKEEYNILRGRWKDYLGRVNKAITERIELKGKAATSLLP